MAFEIEECILKTFLITVKGSSVADIAHNYFSIVKKHFFFPTAVIFVNIHTRTPLNMHITLESILYVDNKYDRVVIAGIRVTMNF